MEDFSLSFVYSVDGGWTSWSSWFTCEQLTGEKCQCRTRTCTQPTPRFNGRTCQGATIEITQCQGRHFRDTSKSFWKQKRIVRFFFLVHGDWSPWREWSLCPNTCGKSFRSRTRTCSNPKPKNNGRLCIGSEREEEPCPEIICSTQSKHLSAWSGEIIHDQSPSLLSLSLWFRLGYLFEILWRRNTKTSTNLFKQ